MDDKAEREQEALRFKALAEQKYNDSNLKSALKYAKKANRLCHNLDGVPEMITAFKILGVAAKSTAVDGGGTPEWYTVLQVEPFSQINTIKKQYKKLALILHPDKNPFVASEEAFKLVGEAFRVLSDKIRRKEYDMKLRIAMQSAATEGGGSAAAVETFWTACSTCRLLHQFERRYLGHNLMCPNCKKSFKAMEVSADETEGEAGRVKTRASVRIQNSERLRTAEAKRKMGSVGGALARSKSKRVQSARNEGANSNGGVLVGLRSRRVQGSKIANENNKDARTRGVEILEGSKSKTAKAGEETMTLAEMQVLAKRKVHAEKEKLKGKVKQREKEKEKKNEREKERDIARESRVVSKGDHLEIERCRVSRRSSETGRHKSLKTGGLEIMAVEDSDFYDFDKDRVERSFKKGQVWAVYDDDDGMPRHYGLIDEVVSVNPFEVKMSWLDLQNDGDVGLICWEKMGFHISCGKFKVARKTSINSVNIFSHIVDCERAAKELYRIYPKKGSVWGLYKENVVDAEERDLLVKDKRNYDIVIFLTTYSEMYGLSMAYLEKVDGFKTVFKRREIGCQAIRWLEKDDIRLFSHQIPARKLSGEEAADISKDCWELDPASLPPELLSIRW